MGCIARNFVKVPHYTVGKEELIPFDKSYVLTFDEIVFSVESHTEKHPIENYYFKLDDASINAKVKMKWIHWGYFFFSSISHALSNWDEELSMKALINNSIQGETVNNNDKKKHVLLLENINITNDDDYLKKIPYDIDVNTTIHFKLLINIEEFLALKDTYVINLVRLKK